MPIADERTVTGCWIKRIISDGVRVLTGVVMSDIYVSRCISKPYFVLLDVRALSYFDVVLCLAPNPGDRHWP